MKTLLLILPYLVTAVYFIYPDCFSVFHGTGIEIVSDMQEQAKLLPQEPSNFFGNGSSMIPSPVHSVARGKTRYIYEQAEYDSAATLHNPLPDNDYVIARGKNRFEIFCVPCHGDDGKGQGIVITKPKLNDDEEGFPAPADLTSRHTRQLSDGRLFHILSAGQNLMFPVNYKMNETDKWAIVKFIRKLQKRNY